MTKQEMTATILSTKRARGLSWEQIGKALGLGPVYVASCCYGENSMTESAANALGEQLGLPAEVVAELTTFPTKGNSIGDKPIPTDPLLYRFYEILAVYGTSMKDVIQELAGDGIMSAIDFTLDIKRQPDPKGDRIVIVMDGKFLAYRKW